MFCVILCVDKSSGDAPGSGRSMATTPVTPTAAPGTSATPLQAPSPAPQDIGAAAGFGATPTTAG